jgi:hypothetical protein
MKMAVFWVVAPSLFVPSLFGVYLSVPQQHRKAVPMQSHSRVLTTTHSSGVPVAKTHFSYT